MPEPTGTEPQGEPAGQEPTDDIAKLREALEKERVIRKEAEKAAKTNADAAKRLAEVEESQKTESQKLAERADAAERRAADLERAVLRTRVAAEKGVPEGSLVGDDEDALRKHADELIAWRDASATKTTPPVRRPVRSGTASGDDQSGKERAAAALRGFGPGR